MRKRRYVPIALCWLVAGLFPGAAWSQSKDLPDRLVKLAEALTVAAQEGRREPFERLAIPNPQAWFAEVFGEPAGGHFGPIYNRMAPRMPLMAYERFLEISSQEDLRFEAANWKSLKGLGRTRQPVALAVWALLRRPEELFALWFTVKDQPKKLLGFWCHAEGEFRLVGWLYVLHVQTSEALFLLGPGAAIREVAASEENRLPAYPPLARQARIGGTVALKAVVTADGTLMGIEVISGHPLLVQSALDTVRTWRYTPLVVDGQIREAVLVIEVLYTL